MGQLEPHLKNDEQHSQRESEMLKDLYRRYGAEVPYVSDGGVRRRVKSFEVWLAEENKRLREELTAAKERAPRVPGEHGWLEAVSVLVPRPNIESTKWACSGA